MGDRRSAAQSRFGLRMIAVFALCAVAPILIFAAFAYARTRDQLEATAVAALRRETKDLSMRLIGRLALAVDALGREAAPTGVAEAAGATAFDALGFPVFESVERRAEPGFPLSEGKRRRLAQGRVVLVEDASDRAHPLKLIRRVAPGDHVVGTVSLDAIFSPDRNQAVQRYWVESAAGELLFAADPDGETESIVERHANEAERTPLELEASQGAEIAMIWPAYLRGYFDHDALRVGTSIPRQIVLAPLASFDQAFLAALALGLLGSIAVGLQQVRRRIEPLDALLRCVRAVAEGDYEARAAFRSGDEFDELGRAFNAMTSEIGESVAGLRKLTRAGSEMLYDPTAAGVAAHLVRQAVDVSGADLAVLFRVPAPANALGPRTRPAAAARRAGDAVALDELAGLELEVVNATSGTPLVLERDHHFGEHAEAWAGFERVLAARVESLMILPLRTGFGPITTQLVLATRRPASEAPFSGRAYHASRILADQAGSAFRVTDLVGNLRGLFEGVIHLTVQAIDEKSPYTGDHCRRVPILTEQIADAVDRTSDGPLKDFRLTPEERYELRIAALLHDCGKVATPVHVMDKATKLETIMDRIEVVRERVEILRRDLEIAALRRAVDSLGAADRIDESALSAAIATLEDDLAFIEKSNVGGEFMDPKAQTRIDEIAARYAWSDRTGGVHPLLSSIEQANLKIARGTLNPEERSVIEGHVSTTIRLLERLPFPAEMARVPYIAGAHHEHIDGSGYPNGLAHDDLNLQSRILGLADVFEALTAKDRPYKPGRTLSESIRILGFMVKDGHIDGELLEIMLREKVHLQYAAEHLAPEQIDGAYREELERLTAPWSVANASFADEGEGARASDDPLNG
ncbi:MAG: HD domain-containing phosphohydrolase [Myxococcota bacterium]